MSKVLIVGDVHEEFAKLNRLINKRKPEVVIATGDFRLWEKHILRNELKPQGAKIYACEGNHENFKLIRELRESVNNRQIPIEVVEDVYYMPRGTVIALNGFKLLFIGGAESHDKEYRTEGIDWFPEESITPEDIYNLPKGKVDVVISHCAPDFVREAIGFTEIKGGHSSALLGYVFEDYKPDLWYFSHYHIDYRSLLRGCLFEGLHFIGNGKCWAWLPESNDG